MGSDPGETLSPGDVIGRYQLTSLLASGGMGEVWTARPTGAGFARTVALKLVRGEMSGDENYARMFIDEATVASSIHHPNVCETYELGRHGDRLFMAMEWVAGDSLAGLLRQGDALEVRDLLASRPASSQTPAPGCMPPMRRSVRMERRSASFTATSRLQTSWCRCRARQK